METAMMAKPKPKKSTVKREPRTISFRTSGEYGDWVDELAARNRTSIAALIDQALTKFAESIDFREPPER